MYYSKNKPQWRAKTTFSSFLILHGRSLRGDGIYLPYPGYAAAV